jgi:hypothetical protein
MLIRNPRGLHIKLHLSPSPTDGSNYAYTMLSSNIFLIGVLYYNFVGGGGPLGTFSEDNLHIGHSFLFVFIGLFVRLIFA